MSKQNQIPTTAFVPPYSPEMGVGVWAEAVASFANGMQAVKDNDGIKAVRIGSLIHIQGSITILGTLLYTELLPVAPRASGYLQTYASDGSMRGAPYNAESKSVDFTGFENGTYYISGQYLAQLKERF